METTRRRAGEALGIALAGLSLALTSTVSPAHAADGFKAMAKEFSRAAHAAGMGRVAVLPFSAADGGDSRDGLSISEKLITQMVRTGQVRVVERSLLRNLMEEQRLAQTGMVDQTTLKRIGRVFAVEGIVTGSFVAPGREVVINARLIDVETGAILAAMERHVGRERLAGPGFASSRVTVFNVPAPEFFVAAPPLPPDLSEMRDAPADNSCLGAAERVDDLESQVLDLKARHWAAQLKKGASLASVKVNPGSTITDPSLKKRFYDRMRYYYGLDHVPELTPSEAKRFLSLDERAYSLYRECGI